MPEKLRYVATHDIVTWDILLLLGRAVELGYPPSQLPKQNYGLGKGTLYAYQVNAVIGHLCEHYPERFVSDRG